MVFLLFLHDYVDIYLFNLGGTVVWGYCEAPEALRSSGRRQARSAQPLCRGERSPIHRAPTGRKSVGQWGHIFYSHTFGMLFTRCGLPVGPGFRASRLPPAYFTGVSRFALTAGLCTVTPSGY